MKISIIRLLTIGISFAPHLSACTQARAGTHTTITLDGSNTDPIWNKTKKLPLLQWSKGFDTHNKLKTKVTAIQAGKWFLVGMTAKETSPLFADESIRNGQIWSDDVFNIKLIGTSNKISITVNPIGTLYINTKSKYSDQAVVTATKVTDEFWRAEVAIDLQEFGLYNDRQLTLSVERERPQRGFTPFSTATMEPTIVELDKTELSRNIVVKKAPAQQFYTHTILPAAQFDKKELTPDDWSHITPTFLHPETVLPVISEKFQKTIVRSAITKDAIEIKIDCYDSSINLISGSRELDWNGDVIEVALGPDSYNYLHIAANPQGAVKATIGKTGGRWIKSTSLPKDISIVPSRDKDKWTITFKIPFSSILDKFNIPATCTPSSYPWRIQIARTRPNHPASGELAQTSMLAVTKSFTFHCPLRFASIQVVKPSDVALATPIFMYPKLPAPVLTKKQQSEIKPHDLVANWVESQVTSRSDKMISAFNKVKTLDDWKKLSAELRKEYMQAALPATNGKLPATAELNATIVYDLPQDGFRIQGLIIQSQAGMPVPITLCVPESTTVEKHPAMIIVPAHHSHRNHFQLYNLGANFARAGGIALISETLGSGERGISSRRDHKNEQRYQLGAQLILAGEELSGWSNIDLKATVDYLYQRGDIDTSRIAAVGAVAGGGDVTAQAALADPRITLSIPFNFSQHPADEDWYDLIRSYPASTFYKVSPAIINALRAPALFINAQEFDWTKVKQKRHAVFTKVYSLFNATNNLDYFYGYKGGDVTHIGKHHRMEIYRIINKWWYMQLPTTKEDDFTISEKLKNLECFDKEKGLIYLNAMYKEYHYNAPHDIAAANVKEALKQSRKLTKNKPTLLKNNLANILGDITPVMTTETQLAGKLTLWRNANVERLWLPAESGHDKSATPGIAAWLLTPKGNSKTPLVIATAQAGKLTFLTKRSKEIERLIESGIAVALVDLRGCGETMISAGRVPKNRSQKTAIKLVRNGGNMISAQLKDIRTTIYALALRTDIDVNKFALWGEGFTEPNGDMKDKDLFSEGVVTQTSPIPKTMVEPMGAWLSLLAGLYPIEVDGSKIIPKAILIRGGIASFNDIVENEYYHIPFDSIIPGLLRTADVSDVVKAIMENKITLIAEDMRNAKNKTVTKSDLHKTWGKATPRTYREKVSTNAINKLIKQLAGP